MLVAPSGSAALCCLASCGSGSASARFLGDLLKDRAFKFAVERVVFVATLHRLFVSGSDRDCAAWMEDYDIPGAGKLGLHHFYRAMAWLGEESEEKRAEALAPRCVKPYLNAEFS